MESFIIVVFIDFMICIVIDQRAWLLWQLKCCRGLIMKKMKTELFLPNFFQKCSLGGPASGIFLGYHQKAPRELTG